MSFHRAAAWRPRSRACSARPPSPTSSNRSDPSARYRKTCGGNRTIEPARRLPSGHQQKAALSSLRTAISPFAGGQRFASVGISTSVGEADRLPLGRQPPEKTATNSRQASKLRIVDNGILHHYIAE